MESLNPGLGHEKLKPGSFGHRGLIGKKVVAKEANRVSAKCAIHAGA
jgi:hypothetical protein